MSNIGDTLASTEHLLAGNAVFTVTHGDERYTYHFYAAKQGCKAGKTFARLLTGPNNTADYTEIGEIDPTTGDLSLTGRIGAGSNGVPVSVALARWLAKLAATKQPTPEGLVIHHAGHCLCCRKLLTVPYPDNPYRIFGLGPICGGK